MKILVTGSGGLIGSEATKYYGQRGHEVVGIDNNMRQTFFGPAGDVQWNIQRLVETVSRYRHFSTDIRDKVKINELFKEWNFDVVIHCAAQPSHDKAKEIPIIDFEVNALGTLNLLEACRLHSREAIFIYMSTNKVYGDAPNELAFKEFPTRWDYERPEDSNGISESCRIDQTLHSLFGASKLAGDIVTQEYGRYFGLRTGIFRGGCLTGPSHSGVELHGFLSYLVKVAVRNKPYKIFGYKGKQVRDNIHSRDVIAAFDQFIGHPRSGEVYNLGGGRSNSVSILEAIDLIEQISRRKISWSYEYANRLGDHICYISDLTKFQNDFPNWRVTVSLTSIIEEMVEAEFGRLAKSACSTEIGL